MKQARPAKVPVRADAGTAREWAPGRFLLEFPVYRVVDEEGRLVEGAELEIPEAELLALYRWMVLGRSLDERMVTLQRQGRIGFYIGAIGEEATVFGTVAALAPQDWIFPSYREHGAAFMRGLPLTTFMANLFGNAGDVVKGRQMPCHETWAPGHFVSISSPIATQVTQAVGAAWAARIQGDDMVPIAFFGDGSTSAHDFHTGLNFASVRKIPVVFVCRNNGWAISVPREKQTAAKTFASKAVGYGMPGVRVDGNDILAMLQVAGEAIDRARAGDGPTLIEALTYRVQGHSSSDDPSVYRDPKEPEIWEKRDPLNRMRNYLRHRGLWDEAWERDITERYNQEITDALAAADKLPAPAIETMFEDVFEEMPWHLREQRDWLMQQARTRSPHFHG